MRVISFRDQVVRPGEWAVLFACYLVPVLNLILLPVAWFLCPLFALLIFLLNPRTPIIRFHFLQALLCFLFFAALTVFGSLLSAFNGNRSPYIEITAALFWIASLGYFLLALLAMILLFFRRSLHLPLLGRFAERFANRTARRAQEREKNVQ
jgi:uncharacterized membrane protein